MKTSVTRIWAPPNGAWRDRSWTRSPAVAVLVACMLLSAQAAAQSAWTLGSPSAVVSKVQGSPDLIEKLASLGYEVWRYGDNSVRLSYADNRVSGWWNADGTLKVELRPGADTTSDSTFTAGSTRDDVVRLQGTPTAVERRGSPGVTLLRYGPSVVSVSTEDGRVVSWQDTRGIFRTRPGRAPLARTGRGAMPPMPLTPDPVARTTELLPSLAAQVALDGARVDAESVIDAESRGALNVTVWNAGPGTAYGVSVSALLEQPTPGLDVGRGGNADSIPAERSASFRVELATSAGLRDGTVVLRVTVNDRHRQSPSRDARLTLRTRALRPPWLVLEGVGVRDQSGNGRIESREIVDITARVGNHGSGRARDVRFVVGAGRDIELTPESARGGSLGDLAAGEVRDVQISAFARATAAGFPVSLFLREARPRFDTVFVLPLALDRPLAALPALTVRGRDVGQADLRPPLVVDVDTGIVRAPARSNAVAVVLGVERYERAPAVEFARHDAAVFREYAQRVFGIGDDVSRLHFRTDDEVTTGELRRLFGEGGWLSKRVTPESDVIVYWAGHGQTDPRTKEAYLLPNDADPNYPAITGLSLTELYERLAALKARSVVVFIDACFSGLTRSGAALRAGVRGVVVSLEHPALRSETMAVFSAATGEQVASSWPQRQHGLFTYWLLRGLRGDADGSGDGAVSVGELGRFIHNNVSRTVATLDREQTSQVVARDTTRLLVWLR